MSTKNIIKGTLIFAVSGIICRILGFVFRIYLSRIISASQIGLYQMVMPICILGQAAAAGGLTTAVSKYTSAYLVQNRKDKGYINFLSTLLFSVLLSALVTLLIACNSRFIAKGFLHNEDCQAFLIIAAYSIPFASIHSIIASYFIGLEKHGIPAIAQVLEQIVRMAAIYVFCRMYNQTGVVIDGKVALYGILAGEFASSMFTFLAVIFLDEKYKTERTGLIRTPVYYLAEGIMQLAVNLRLGIPITLNRISLHLIQSIEAFLLPMMLMTFGMTYDESLAAYGVLTGMTIPLLMFPATLTNSMSQALLPDISMSWQSKAFPRLHKSISMSFEIASNLGFLSIFGFYFYGARFGELIFDTEMVKSQVGLLCIICPFIFVATPLSSILNAIGRSGTVLISNLASQVLKLALIVILIPRYEMTGYIYAATISHAFGCIWQMYSLKKITGCHYSVIRLVIAPVIRCTICFFATYPIYPLLSNHSHLPEAVVLVVCGALFVVGFGCFSSITADKARNS